MATVLDNIGIALSYSKVLAPVGSAFGYTADILETVADLSEGNPYTGYNMGVRLTNTTINHIVGKQIDKIPINEDLKTVIKGGVNHGTEVLENKVSL